MRHMMVKNSIFEIGVGTTDATLVSESCTSEYGEFAHLSVTADGRYFLSITDMEEASGSYTSIELAPNDPWIAALKAVS